MTAIHTLSSMSYGNKLLALLEERYRNIDFSLLGRYLHMKSKPELTLAESVALLTDAEHYIRHLEPVLAYPVNQ